MGNSNRQSQVGNSNRFRGEEVVGGGGRRVIKYGCLGLARGAHVI
jgi:hypothetical protein